jgi:hypothetical protein
MRKTWLALSLLSLVAAGGWTLAYYPVEQRAENQKPSAVQATPPPGRFALVRAGDTTLLLDTAAGQSWTLQCDADGNTAWVPVRRLTGEAEIQQWQKRRQERARPVTTY